MHDDDRAKNLREELEARIRAACDARDHEGALTLALAGYGPELTGFLAARMRSEDDAADVFAVLAEDMWKGLPSFRFDASFRTWAYCLARRAAARFHRGPGRKAARAVPLSQASLVAQLEHQVREQTAEYQKTTMKDRLHALREQLDDEDRLLLVLRVDRGLDWGEIARVVADDDLDEAARKASAAKLRKRFERLKTKLRALAIEHGLLPADGAS